MLDIGGTTADPTDETLTLSAIDYPTLKTISEDGLIREMHELLDKPQVEEGENADKSTLDDPLA